MHASVGGYAAKTLRFPHHYHPLAGKSAQTGMKLSLELRKIEIYYQP